MDIYKQMINTEASEKQTVNVGRISALIAWLWLQSWRLYWEASIKPFSLYKNTPAWLVRGFWPYFYLDCSGKKHQTKARSTVHWPLSIALFFKVGPKGWMADSGLEAFFPPTLSRPNGTNSPPIHACHCSG